MSGFEITCANKNYRGVIVRVGGDGWSMATQEAIVKIISKQLRLNILLDDRYVEVGVRGEGMDSYLAIEPDGIPLHDLKNLPGC